MRNVTSAWSVSRMVYYPPTDQARDLRSDELNLKIARHSLCGECDCTGLNPPQEVLVTLTEDDELLNSCGCGHTVEEHGNSASISEKERERRGKVAIRLDEMLEVGQHLCSGVYRC